MMAGEICRCSALARDNRIAARMGAAFEATRFTSAIVERTPLGQWIPVKFHPNGDWSVAHAPHTGEPRMDDDLATDLVLVSIERSNMLRSAIKSALEESSPAEARRILEAVLSETDVGEMKVWQEGEEPF